MPVATTIDNLKDALAIVVEIMESAQNELIFLVPPSVFSQAAASCDSLSRGKRFMQNGGVMRGITTVSSTNLEETRMRLAMGEDLRHSDLTYEFFMSVGDRQQSLSTINVGVSEYTLDTPITAFWSDDPTYAEYLLTSFENAWSRAVPAAQKVEELLAQERG